MNIQNFKTPNLRACLAGRQAERSNLNQASDCFGPSQPRASLADSESGYIALISAIVIAVLLLTITFTLSFTGFFARFNILDNEAKNISAGLASACVNRAIIQIANKDTVSYPDVWDQDTDKQCTVQGVSPLPTAAPTAHTIKAQGVYKESYTNYEVDVTSTASNVTIDSWGECADPC